MSRRDGTGITGRDPADPIHQPSCSADCWWSTDNAGEALPGVITPMTWTFFADSLERAMKGTFFDMGVYRRSEVVAAPDAETRLMDVFYGRAAGNLNTFREIGDRTPGTSGDAIEEQIFGSVRPGVASRPVYSRYPFVAAKVPYAATRLVSRLTREISGTKAWWQQMVAPAASPRWIRLGRRCASPTSASSGSCVPTRWRQCSARASTTSCTR